MLSRLLVVMLVIIDYKSGNIGSILNMLKRIGCTARLSSEIEDIRRANRILLPGVGSFDNGMKNLKQIDGLVATLSERVLVDKIPILGICLGMQLLMERSEEGGEAGLGWIKGEVKRIRAVEPRLRIPHMGWNMVYPMSCDTLFYGLEDEAYFYFVHSYCVHAVDDSHVLGVTEYGNRFVSAVCKENIFGVQFHPEKSHKFGMQLLKNFVERL